MEQCASTASLLASVREQERQFEMLSRALEDERRSCAGTLPRPLPPAMQVTLENPSERRRTPTPTPPLSPPVRRDASVCAPVVIRCSVVVVFILPSSSPPSSTHPAE